MAGRTLAMVKQCPECLVEFHPYHRQQVCCCASCGATRRYRLRPEQSQAWSAKAHQARYQKYTVRLIARLRGLTPLQIWRLAYLRGYSAARLRWQRNGVA